LFPALFGAVICVFFTRSGLLGIFFLVPLGFIGYGWGPRALWPCLGFVFLFNSLFTLGMGLIAKASGLTMALDILFFTSMTVAFAWIILPPPIYGSRIPGAYRLALGSSLCAVISAGLFLNIVSSPAFQEVMKDQIEVIAAVYRGAGFDLTQDNILDSLTIDTVLEVMKSIIIRGGALVSSICILFASRQVSIFLIGFFGAKRRSKVFMDFHVDPRLVMILGFSVLLLTVSSLFRLSGLSIILWNIVILCGMMYLAQGFGILRFFLLRLNVPSFVRYLLPVLFVFLLFRPVINVVLLGTVILLGIAENWVSFRKPGIRDNYGPSSTPGA
jgi:hypothetical protein